MPLLGLDLGGTGIKIVVLDDGDGAVGHGERALDAGLDLTQHEEPCRSRDM